MSENLQKNRDLQEFIDFDDSKPAYGKRFESRLYKGVAYRWCSKGQHWRPLHIFPRNSSRKDGYDDYCTDCRNSYHIDIGLHRRGKYGITPEQFEDLLRAQDYKCAICKNEMVSPHLDHCHDTEAIRGVLCKSCNFGLGFFRDDVELLNAAVEYLLNGK